MDFSRVQDKLISAVVAYFGLGFITQQLAKMPNLDAKQQSAILSALGALLPMLVKTKSQQTNTILENVGENWLFAGLSMLIPSLQAGQTAGSAGGAVAGMYAQNFGANAYIGNMNGEQFQVTNMIAGAQGSNYPGTAQYINCPPNPAELVKQIDAIMQPGEVLADMQGNVIYQKNPPALPLVNGEVKPVGMWEFCN